MVAAFVPRLWAAEYLRRLMGSSEDPELLRGKIMQLGVAYGLMTPYTSILALESEQAFRQQGIQRRHRPLRGVRLTGLDAVEESKLLRALGVITVPMGLGCTKFSEEAPASMAGQEQKRDQGYQHEAVAGLQVAPGGARPPAPEGKAMMTARPVKAKRMTQPSPVVAKKEQLETFGDSAKMSGGMDDESIASVGGKGGAMAAPKSAKRPRRRQSARQLAQICSDASRRSLRERVILWRKRLRTAKSAPELINRYQAARQACEVPDWRSEATFLRVMQPFVRDEGSAVFVLRFFSGQPDVQRYLARLILRRAVDKNVISAVERVLFLGRVNWAQVDIELSELPELPARIARLREVMALAPNDPNGILRLVHLLAKAVQVDEALIQGRRLRDSGLATPFLARELGDLLASQKLADEAVRTYSEIVEFDPASAPSRRLLGDIYLAHGWYDPAYRQFKSLVEKAPGEALNTLRLAAAAAGSGRVDEALRLERQVARAPGRPGPDDPRRFAKLWSAARLARMLDKPPEGSGKPEKLKKSMQSKLKELQLLRGQGTLVLLTWEDLSANLRLSTVRGGKEVAMGEAINASVTGLSAAILSSADLDNLDLQARLASLPRRLPLKITRHDLSWDGKQFAVKVTEHVLVPGAASVNL